MRVVVLILNAIGWELLFLMVRFRFAKAVSGPVCTVSRQWTVIEHARTVETKGAAGVERNRDFFMFRYSESMDRLICRLWLSNGLLD